MIGKQISGSLAYKCVGYSKADVTRDMYDSDEEYEKGIVWFQKEAEKLGKRKRPLKRMDIEKMSEKAGFSYWLSFEWEQVVVKRIKNIEAQEIIKDLGVPAIKMTILENQPTKKSGSNIFINIVLVLFVIYLIILIIQK